MKRRVGSQNSYGPMRAEATVMVQAKDRMALFHSEVRGMTRSDGSQERLIKRD